MSGSKIKYIGRERNKRIKQTMTTIFLLLIVTHYTTINQTYRLLHNTLMCQVITLNKKVEKETKGLNQLLQQTQFFY